MIAASFRVEGVALKYIAQQFNACIESKSSEVVGACAANLSPELLGLLLSIGISVARADGSVNAGESDQLFRFARLFGFDPSKIFSGDWGAVSQPASGRPWHEVLGITANASLEEIVFAYRKLAMQFHPDIWVQASESEHAAAGSRMKEINAAFDQANRDVHAKEQADATTRSATTEEAATSDVAGEHANETHSVGNTKGFREPDVATEPIVATEPDMVTEPDMPTEPIVATTPPVASEPSHGTGWVLAATAAAVILFLIWLASESVPTQRQPVVHQPTAPPPSRAESPPHESSEQSDADLTTRMSVHEPPQATSLPRTSAVLLPDNSPVFDAEEVLRQPQFEPSPAKRIEMNVNNYRKRHPNATREELEEVERTAKNIEACRPAYMPPASTSSRQPNTAGQSYPLATSSGRTRKGASAPPADFDSKAYMVRGRAWYATRHYENAVEDLTRAIALDYYNEEAYEAPRLGL